MKSEGQKDRRMNGRREPPYGVGTACICVSTFPHTPLTPPPTLRTAVTAIKEIKPASSAYSMRS